MDMDEPSHSRESGDSPSRSEADNPNQPIEEGLAMDAWKNDEQDWNWHFEVERYRIAAEAWVARVKCTCDGDSFMNLTYIDERLGFTFEKEKWIMVQDKTDQVFVAWVHAVRAETLGEDCVDKPHLTITKYCSFQPEGLPWNTTLAGIKNGLKNLEESAEMLLYFSSLDNMGKRADAEVIKIDDIKEVQRASEDFNIQFAKVSESAQPSGRVCRFGRCVKNNTVTIMPIMSHLLPRNDSQQSQVFWNSSEISVFDFTPNVLGPLEGFTEMGYKVLAGAGFDESCHMTWRTRAPRCAVFDGSSKTIFDDFDSGRLMAPNWPPEGSPLVALIAGENSDYRLRPENNRLPSRESFLAPLEILDSITASCLKPDFTVLQISSAVLHSSTLDRFSATILRLLEHGQTVKIDISQAKDFGVPRERLIVSVIASKSQGLATVPIGKAGPPQAGGVNDIARSIADLNFSNPLVSQNEHEGFVCSPPAHQPDDGALSPSNVYNHQTGIAVPATREMTFPVHADGIDVSNSSPWVLVHSERKDRLTVREHARIQGFKNDSILYGPNDAQYRDVAASQPPQVARALAQCIQTVVRQASRAIVSSGNDRPEKRRREDSSRFSLFVGYPTSL